MTNITKESEPQCGWCDAAASLEHEWSEMGNRYYCCSCCGKRTRMDHEGVAHRVQKPLPAIDVNGALIDGP